MTKVCVYAITKNEAKFVQTWYESMKEADYIVVLDTGSTDDTVEQLRSLGVIVEQKIIDPWRFDEARNESMKLVPSDTDVCICTDLDEILRPGWADLVRKYWRDDIDRIMYTYIWSWLPNGEPGVTFDYEKCHKPTGFQWIHPVHEVLVPVDGHMETKIKVPEIVLEHHPDITKSRGQYLGLLKLDVDEHPQDDRARHYYARELMFAGKKTEAIEQFKMHLALPSSTWPAERATSMRYIAKCETENREKERWLSAAIGEAPELREPYVDMALLQYQKRNWYGVIYFAEKALAIKVNQHLYMNDPFAWNELPHDLLSIGYWNIGNIELARKHIAIAKEKAPYNERIAKNYELMNGKGEDDA